MATEARSLLGNGMLFPLNSSQTGGIAYSADIKRINQSLFILFETPKGSRLMVPEFGSDIWKFRFDPLDRILMERLRYTITEEVRRWEPRISMTSIEFLSDTQAIDNSILYISLTYKLINEQVSGNYVYPYKLVSYPTTENSTN